MKAKFVCVALALALSGCGIGQKVTPVAISSNRPKEICVVENKAVREQFLEAYKTDLTNKGLAVRVIPPGSPINSCPMVSTYTARWKWDLAVYLVYADITVFRDGHPEGKAVYDAKWAGLNVGKYINAADKVQELTNQLFPN